MEDHGRHVREDAKETIRQIWQQVRLIRSAINETRERIATSRQLLAQLPPRGRRRNQIKATELPEGPGHNRTAPASYGDHGY